MYATKSCMIVNMVEVWPYNMVEMDKLYDFVKTETNETQLD